MQMCPGVGEPAALDVRSLLCQGSLAHTDLRKNLSRVTTPVLILRGIDNPLIGPEHADAIHSALSGDQEEQPGIRQCLDEGQGCIVVDIDCGHRMLLESRSKVEEALDTLLTAARDLERGVH